MLTLILQDDYTANNFGQQESRDGYSAQGEYFVNLPDGRLQKVIFCSENSAEVQLWDFPKVTYSVNGEGGYVADVSYTGEAQVRSNCNYYHHSYILKAKKLAENCLQQNFAKNVHKLWQFNGFVIKFAFCVY